MFNTEQHLVNTIKCNWKEFLIYKNWNESNDYVLLEELDLGYGIADLVLAENPKIKIKRTQQFSYNDIFLHGVIKRTQGIGYEKIKNVTRLSDNALKRSVNKLITEKAIDKEVDKYVVNSEFVFPKFKSIAIEAKLKNWKRALKQAYRYNWFATYSYVFMDDSHVRPALQNKKMFKMYNVGLASVKENGKIEVHLKPQISTPFDENMETLLGEKLLFLGS